MKRFEILKTIQLAVTVLLAAAALLTVLRDKALYQMVGADPHVRLLSLTLWALFAVSFVFLFLDFGSYTDLKRENLELDHAVYADALTGIANRYSCDAYIGQYLDKPLPADMGCITLDLLNLKEINEQYGHSGGDEALKDFSEVLLTASRSVFDRDDFFLGRNGGNKFLAICRKADSGKLGAYLEIVEKMTAARPAGGRPALRYTEGHACAGEEGTSSLGALVALSDRRAMQA